MRWWRTWPLGLRQGVLLLAATFLVALGVGLLGQQVTAQIRHCLDMELTHQAIALRFWFVNEQFYLRDEAALLANYGDLFAWLANGDHARTRRFLALHQNAHETDHVYLLAAEGEAWYASSTPPLPVQVVHNLDIVQRAFQGQANAELTTIEGRIWLVAAAPHTGPHGEPDAVVFIAREIDTAFLESLVGGMSGVIWLTDGQHWAGTTDRAFMRALGLEQFRPPFDPSLQPYGARYQGHHYRVLVAPLGGGQTGTYALVLVRQAAILERARAQVLLGGGVFTLALLLTAGAILYFHTRAIFAPLHDLRTATARIAQGDLSAPIHPRGATEVADLAQHISTMRDRLRELLEREQALRRQLEQRLANQNNTLERLCRIREQLLTQLITAQEEERRRVSRELHDETSQELANLIVRLSALARTVDDPAVLEALRELREHAARTLEGVNRIVMDLRPGLLDEYGLVPAVRWYADTRLASQGVQVKMTVEGTPQPLPSHVQVTLYRVLQEAIHNIAQHARATQAAIRFQWLNDALQVEVHDDGQGFDPALVPDPAQGHFGLLGMRERVHLVGGSFQVDAAPGRGTRIYIRIPYPASGEQHVGEDSGSPGG